MTAESASCGRLGGEKDAGDLQANPRGVAGPEVHIEEGARSWGRGDHSSAGALLAAGPHEGRRGLKPLTCREEENADIAGPHEGRRGLKRCLRARGAEEPAANWAKNVVIDGRLVTGQNPALAGGVGEAIRDLLRA